ncbi:DUF4363 family protein [Clostridium sp.]|uniref:DUF4363 family protein n=1 Tax=Clostridium sp. TaxID=1506 RepID=UPI003F330FBB
MKNAIISIILFIVLLGGLFFLDSKITSLCDEFIVSCNEIEEHLNSKNYDLAYEKSVELLNLIKDEGDIPAIYLNHVDYDLVMNEALKLALYIRGGDEAESLATLHALRNNSEHLKELQTPNLMNIL